MDNRQEKIEELFRAMDTRRRVLKGILRFLKEKRSADALKEEVDHLQEFDYSVYTSADYAYLLESHGAIVKLSELGTPFSETEDQEPEIIQVDGAEYYKPIDGKKIYWADTEAGLAYLESVDSMRDFDDLVKEDVGFTSVYRKILIICEAENGCSIEDIDAVIDESKLLSGSSRRAPYFVEKLERCDALQWAGTWRITKKGSLCLEAMNAYAEKISLEKSSGSESEE